MIYGSYLRDDFVFDRSDIDVAILTHQLDKSQNLQTWYSVLGKAHPKYDIRVFELLPLYIQIEIVRHYQVLFGNPLDISEYFYEYRKLWKDMEPRIKENQFENIADQEQGIQRWKAFISKHAPI